jgi:hypothetical protein
MDLIKLLAVNAFDTVGWTKRHNEALKNPKGPEGR